MNWRQLIIRATSAATLTALMTSGQAQAEPMLIKFHEGVLCDKADQVEEVISQYGQKPLKAVLVALNARTGKTSCGMVSKPALLVMESQKVVATPGGKMVIVKLTARSGMVQYTWRALGSSKEDGQAI
ncbi:MAG: hypothetical protein ACR2O4_11990 [Hyphomicrobiaceae bacterium]